MLSGQGADEYLGGYRRYEAAWLLAKIPNLLRIALIHLGRLSTYLVPNNRIAFKRRLLRLIDLAKLSPTMRMLGMYTWTSPTLINKLLPNNSPWLGSYIFEELFDSYLDKEIIDIMMLVDHHYDLMSLNLCYTDRMSMAVGVEARVPFLDFELVKVMNTIPTSLKVYKGQGKYIFKKAMEPYLPKEVIHRDKAGFGLPLRAWLREEQDILNHYFDFKKIKQQGLFDSKIIENLLVSQNFGREDHTYSIYSLLNQQIWLEHSKL
jgi:asparagine synthase (glutamine-hydrolysing)